MPRQEESGGRGTRSGGQAQTKHRWDDRWRTMRDSIMDRGKTPSPGGPARPCAPPMSCGSVRHNNAFITLRCWQAQREIAGPGETRHAVSRSTPDQQLGRTPPHPVTSVHLPCSWKLCVISLMTSPPTLACTRGLRLVFTLLRVCVGVDVQELYT